MTEVAQLETPPNSTTQLAVDVMQKWHDRAEKSSAGHYLAAAHYDWWDTWLSGINIASSIMILWASTAPEAKAALGKFAKFALHDSVDGAFLIGLIGAINVLLGGIQLISKDATKSIEHKHTASDLADLARTTQQKLAVGSINEATLETVRVEFDTITSKALPIPSKFYDNIFLNDMLSTAHARRRRVKIIIVGGILVLAILGSLCLWFFA